MRDVNAGDHLRVDDGPALLAQQVSVMPHFQLTVIDHQGLLWDIHDTDQLERWEKI